MNSDLLVFGAGAISLTVFVLTVLNVGTGLLYRFKWGVVPEIRLLASLILGLIAVAAIGLLVWVLPLPPMLTSAIALLGINAVAAADQIRRRRFGFGEYRRGEKAVVGLWLVISLALLALVTIPFDEPRPRFEGDVPLYDGPYVFKDWTLPVRIQFLAGNYPADNALPAYVTEYIVRGISFAEVRPVMPGQEVANRPILQSIIGVPFRSLFGGAAPSVGPDEVPEISYVGSIWPNVGGLISEQAFASTLGPFIAANALLVVVLYSLVVAFGVTKPLLVTTVFTAANSYFLLHSAFTWPKNLAAFFILSALLLAIQRRNPAAVLAVASLGYLSHPYGITFLFGFMLYFAFSCACSEGKFVLTRDKFFRLSALALIPIATVGGWYVCYRFGWGMSSDLIQQNAGQVGAAKVDIIWIRIANALGILLPSAFMAYPFNPGSFYSTINTNLISTVGFALLLVMPVAMLNFMMRDHYRALVFCCILVPAALVTWVFGIPAVAFLHGWQAVWPVLLAISLVEGQRLYGSRFTWSAMGLQVMMFGFVTYSFWRYVTSYFGL